MIQKILMLLAFALCVSVNTEARFATRPDAESELLFQHWTIEVEKDGSYTSTVEMKVKILKEGGKKNWITQPLVYEQDLQEVKILEASTQSEGQTYSVTSKNIEDKPVASGFEGFSNYRQILISFPQTQIGSELYLKYRLKQTEAYISKVFSFRAVYGGDLYVQQADLHIISHLPLEMKVHDSEDYLAVTADLKNGTQLPQHYSVVLKRPLMRKIVDETQNHLDPKRYPTVSVTSLHSWNELSTLVTPKYEAVLAEPLPPLFVEIAEGAAKKKTLIEKINDVTSHLAVALNYRGDWTSVSGKFYPRSLAAIADQRRSDCKDFSSSTVAILRKLGIEAHVALVRRGGIYEDPVQLPDLSAFNHAIVRVKDGGQIHWIDPTNFTSYAQGIFPDIAGRYALPLLTGSDRQWIPAIRPSENQIQVNAALRFQAHEQAVVEGSVKQLGVAAIHATGALLRASKETIDYSVISVVGNIDRVLKYEVKPYDLTSRIVSDHVFQYQFLAKDIALKSNLGPAYPMKPSSLVGQLLMHPEGRVSDLYLAEAPVTIRMQTQLKSVRVTRPSAPCGVQSPWMDATRRIVVQKGSVVIEDQYTLKAHLIPNVALTSLSFRKFQDQLDSCFNNRILIFSNH